MGPPLRRIPAKVGKRITRMVEQYQEAVLGPEPTADHPSASRPRVSQSIGQLEPADKKKPKESAQPADIAKVEWPIRPIPPCVASTKATQHNLYQNLVSTFPGGIAVRAWPSPARPDCTVFQHPLFPPWSRTLGYGLARG